ncbi:hypothetical protein FHR24_000995 [Wenyingzhuangia heitensis]|uniref:WbqC-like protein family protein n=1 Tax=Wenyingzhuangia heitensis TaxID=1487859 RepID=A0ABX0UAF8_9FLAO|nr:WbqC family protein [Wenyingzhuangia heitensis]NIJ44556.1 hypothetical protein [Wenyingzhuangia heitensis]
MSKNIVVQPAYFAPIAQYAAIIQSASTTFELHDHFTKQTYRTRCYIYAANGKLLLNVPVTKSKEAKTITPNIEINYAEDWQKLHLRSLQSAYSSSPFFEYYEHDLITIFEKKYKYLADLHMACHHFVMDALQEKTEITTTKEYLINSTKIDLRDWITLKKELGIKFDRYIQVFDDKHGFLPNLSIIDLIFMEGPNAITYLEKLNLSNDIS